MHSAILWAFMAPACAFAQWQGLGQGLAYSNARSFVVASMTQRLYVFGQFDFADDTIPVGGTAFWADGTWHAMSGGVDGSAFNGPIASTEFDGAIYVGGFFPSMDSVPNTHGLAKWEADSWQSLGTISGTGHPIGMTSMNGELHALGRFDSINGVWCNNWAIYDGISWRRADTSIVIDNRPTHVLCYQNDIYLSGNYSMPGSIHDIARKVGGSWQSLGSGLGCDPWVNDMMEFHGLLYVGGEFCPIGAGTSYLMVWDGSQWFDPFPQIEFTNQVLDLHLMNGRLVIAGRLQVVGAIEEYGLAWYDGVELCVFGGEDVPVSKLGGAGDSLFVSLFTPFLNGDPVPFIAKWDMNNAPDTCFTVIQGLDHPQVDAMTLENFPIRRTGNVL